MDHTALHRHHSGSHFSQVVAGVYRYTPVADLFRAIFQITQSQSVVSFRGHQPEVAQENLEFSHLFLRISSRIPSVPVIPVPGLPNFFVLLKLGLLICISFPSPPNYLILVFDIQQNGRHRPNHYRTGGSIRKIVTSK